jgi:hypothetical protein
MLILLLKLSHIAPKSASGNGYMTVSEKKTGWSRVEGSVGQELEDSNPVLCPKIYQ